MGVVIPAYFSATFLPCSFKPQQRCYCSLAFRSSALEQAPMYKVSMGAPMRYALYVKYGIIVIFQYEPLESYDSAFPIICSYSSSSTGTMRPVPSQVVRSISAITLTLS